MVQAAKRIGMITFVVRVVFGLHMFSSFFEDVCSSTMPTFWGIGRLAEERKQYLELIASQTRKSRRPSPNSDRLIFQQYTVVFLLRGEERNLSDQ